MSKTVGYYLGLPYTIELWRAPEGGWVVRVKELPGCVSQGETAEEALAMIQDAMQGWLEVALEYGDPIPEPRPEEEYSGKFVVRVSRGLHRDLVATADREGISLNQYINIVLAQAVGRAASSLQRRSHTPPDGFDPAVRKLEKLTERLELSLASRPELLSIGSGPGLGYRLQRPAQTVLHEDRPDYGINVDKPDTMPEERDRPDVGQDTSVG